MRAILNSTVWLAAAVAIVAVGAVRAEEPDGKALYAKKCAMCHGADGVAKEMFAKKGAKNFNDPAWQKEKTDADITKAITDGFPEKQMQPFKDKLKPEEIAAVIKYLRTLAPAK